MRKRCEEERIKEARCIKIQLEIKSNAASNRGAWEDSISSPPSPVNEIRNALGTALENFIINMLCTNNKTNGRGEDISKWQRTQMVKCQLRSKGAARVLTSAGSACTRPRTHIWRGVKSSHPPTYCSRPAVSHSVMWVSRNRILLRSDISTQNRFINMEG